MTRDAPDTAALRAASARTLAHYEAAAAAFWAGTRAHDVSQNRDALARHLAAHRGPGPWRILDFGCGPGRDLAAFAALGHEAVGLDGCAAFCAMARAHSGCEVWAQDFLALDLPAGWFDGVFANASLFHVPLAALPRVLGALRDALAPGGVLLASNPRGHDEEGFSGERWGVFHTPEGWVARVTAAGFTVLEEYYRPPGLPRARQPWHVSVFRRT
jgi:SAM-dependent methyltransferase